jgi:hypothetical protein
MKTGRSLPSFILYSAGLRSIRCMKVRTLSPMPELKYVQMIFSILATFGSLSHEADQGLLLYCAELLVHSVRILFGAQMHLLDMFASVAAGFSSHFFKAIVRKRQSDRRFKASGVFTPFSVCGES